MNFIEQLQPDVAEVARNFNEVPAAKFALIMHVTLLD